VRAYATTSAGTGYGGANQITTIVTTPNVSDIDGNVYHTITIGTQVWMVENLKTTKYNDGTAIPFVTDNTAWATLTSPAHCFYNNDVTTYKNTYGALYNWYAVNTGKLAPTGWHVPTDAEWTTLVTYVSANTGTSGSLAKALAATTNWVTSYTNAGAIGYDLTKNNSSGFSALPGGWRIKGGSFSNLGVNGFWWSSTGYDTDSAWIRYMENDYPYGEVIRYGNFGEDGYSVRCIRD